MAAYTMSILTRVDIAELALTNIPRTRLDTEMPKTRSDQRDPGR